MRTYFPFTLVAGLLGLVVTAAGARGQCQAPAAWFPHARTPEPDFHAPASNCEFHQWAWQTFLWLTQPSVDGRIRLLDLPTADSLFLPGRAPATLNASARARLAKQPLILTPRVNKKEGPSSLGDVRQAGSRGVLVDRAGHPVYYASHVSPTFYQFVRTNRLFLREEYLAAPSTLNFPVKSLELKSSWRVVPPGGTALGFFTTQALIHPLACRDGGDGCVGDAVVVDLTRTEEVTVALVGLHVVGVVEDHPEFIWSTFEHIKNAPDLPPGVATNAPGQVSGDDFTFYTRGTPAKDCNVPNAGSVKLEAKNRTLSPVTQVFREFAFGGGDASDTANIKSLTADVHRQLAADSVWKNYFLVGGVWFGQANGLAPGLSGPAIQQLTVASVQLSNSTMETFTQHAVPPGKTNCFSCHHTGRDVGLQLPPKNLNVSHVLKNGLVQRAEFARVQARTSRAIAVVPLKKYADVQALLNDFVTRNNIPIQFAPHGAFWRTMTHQQFIEGDIPGVSDPSTGKPLRNLVSNNSKASNLIMALRGTPGSLFDPVSGLIGRMPPSGPFMPDDDIDRIADWIDRGCPDGP